MLYCVFNGKEIIGRFKREYKAIEYVKDCWSCGIKKAIIKPMNEEEYIKYMKKILDKSKPKEYT